MWSVPESQNNRTDWPQSVRPPWPATVRAALWWHRASDESIDYTVSGHHRIPITLGMMVEYLDSPVGPYREVMASPRLTTPARRFGFMPRMQVPFIAVDSEASVHGGQTHWNLPKTLAEFDGDVCGHMLASGAGADGQPWAVETTARPSRIALPIAGALGFAQPLSAPDAALDHLRAAARLVGVFRPARIEVSAEGSTLSQWLIGGSHPGVVITRGRMVTGPGSRC